MSTIVIVPDCHASPETDNSRFIWLGRLLFELNPDIIVNLGDLGDMGSLSSYDRGKKSFEGRRYRNDILCVQDALQKIEQPLIDYNNKQKNIRKAKRKEPRKIITLGNHENRISRAVESSPELEGVLSVDDLKYEGYGYEVYPFKQPVEVEGIWICHYFPSGVKGEPISGWNIGASLIQKNMVSSIVGHSHLWDMAIRAKPNGEKVIGLSAGWYGTEPTYSDATEQLWTSGITILKNVNCGNFDFEFISIERIKREYS